MLKRLCCVVLYLCVSVFVTTCCVVLTVYSYHGDGTGGREEGVLSGGDAGVGGRRADRAGASLLPGKGRQTRAWRRKEGMLPRRNASGGAGGQGVCKLLSGRPSRGRGWALKSVGTVRRCVRLSISFTSLST